MTSFAVVCTTIGDGSFLTHYAKALNGADARMIVIPDRKTPKAIYEAYDTYSYDGVIDCPTPGEQADWLEKLGAPAGFFPWDTDHRRNVGYLMAYESGADVVISIDDDNLPESRWLKNHGDRLKDGLAERVMHADCGFWNPGGILHSGDNYFWPRGFPYSARTREPGYMGTVARVDVAINAGLWSGEPDVDAITRLAMHPQSHGMFDHADTVLERHTWAPVNSQNTAVRREVIPAYYFFRSPRFGDIYQGYLAQACAKHLGHSVRFGTPVVRHERNEHDLLADLEAELPDIRVLDRWLEWLTAAKPEGSTYAAAYASLAEELDELARVETLGRRPQIISGMPAQMRQWLKLCERISG